MTGIVVRPVRFTDNIGPMRAFLELLGLVARLESGQGAWVEMAAAGGLVSLHSAAGSDTGGLPGQTRLSFEADDVDQLAAVLDEAGTPEVRVYDEAYGRAVTCQDPLGDLLVIDEAKADLYGYRNIAPTEPAALIAEPLRFCDPGGPYARFLRALGLEPVRTVSPHYVKFGTAGGDRGLVGLQRHSGGHPPVIDGPAAVQLCFESDKPLTELANTLTQGGFTPESITSESGRLLSVIDPDGQPVQIQAPVPGRYLASSSV